MLSAASGRPTFHTTRTLSALWTVLVSQVSTRLCPFHCDLKHSTSYSSSSPFPLEIIDNSGDIEKIASFLAVQPNLIATEEDASMLEIIESYTAETDAQRGKVVASAGQNICNNRGQGPGTTDSGCEDRPIQTLLGGGTCLLVSQGD